MTVLVCSKYVLVPVVVSGCTVRTAVLCEWQGQYCMSDSSSQSHLLRMQLIFISAAKTTTKICCQQSLRLRSWWFSWVVMFLFKFCLLYATKSTNFFPSFLPKLLALAGKTECV